MDKYSDDEFKTERFKTECFGFVLKHRTINDLLSTLSDDLEQICKCGSDALLKFIVCIVCSRIDNIKTEYIAYKTNNMSLENYTLYKRILYAYYVNILKIVREKYNLCVRGEVFFDSRDEQTCMTSLANLPNVRCCKPNEIVDFFVAYFERKMKNESDSIMRSFYEDKFKVLRNLSNEINTFLKEKFNPNILKNFAWEKIDI